jgi:acetyl coenzyme A synthetase (ADP forming)-like protein
MANTSLDPIFSPRSVAVIGASRKRGSIGFSLLHNLILQEFQGAIYPVNPHAEVVHSLKAYPSIGAIADPIDLAVIMVPKPYVARIVDECVEKGVRGIVVITAGFAESGEEGAALERQIRDRVRTAGLRMVGPNCMGVINADPAVSLNATFAPVPASSGSIGFVSQSGALGVAILNVAQSLGIGLTQFVSMGNKADVSGNDLLEYWEDDPATRVICMYLESFGNPRNFTQIAKRVSRSKPILVVKSGRTEEGARAASSHTGAIAGADLTVSTFLSKCGVLRANTIDDLFNVARALDRCPLPEGNRVGILTNAGGPAIMATDACVNLGLRMAELGEATRQELESFLPAEASVSNPVDMIASATAEQYERALSVMAADPAVDSLLAINVTPLLASPYDVLEAVARAAKTAAKPVLAVMMATEEFYETIKSQPDHPPVYRFPESAARALASIVRYADWRRRPADESIPVFDVDDDAVASILNRQASGYLPPEDAMRVLELYGIPTAAWRRVHDTEGLAAAAEALGLPVVLKAIAPDLVHKSDVGAVRVGLETVDEVRQAADEIANSVTAAGHTVEDWLLQEMAREGHEVIFGISTDPKFGPLLMFGLGGKYVEVFRDVRFGVTPLAPSEADEMIRGIRGFKLLEGVRGEPAADMGILRETLLRLAQMTQRHPRILELDLNPFLAAPHAEQARAVDVRIRVGEPPMLADLG